MWLPLIRRELKTLLNVRSDTDYYWIFDLLCFSPPAIESADCVD